MARRNLRDDQWERIKDLLPGKASDPGRTAADNRLFVEAILWMARAGCPWRDLGGIRSLEQRVQAIRALVERRHLAPRVRRTLRGCRFRGSLHGLDHRQSSPARRRCPKKNGDQALGRSRGGLTTKIHALVEGLGQLARWTLTPGQTHDVTQAQTLLEGITADSVAADKAYDADALIQAIRQSGARAVIPPKANRKEQRYYDKHQYRHRNLVERFFCRMKHFRRVATRYDKLASRFSTFIALVACFIWLT